MGLFDDGASLAIGSALDSVALRQRVSADNIANAMTPGYRAQKVDFESALQSAVASGDPGAATASVSDTDAAAREDGNNVEIDAETMTLSKADLQYQALTQAMNFKLSVLSTALKG